MVKKYDNDFKVMIVELLLSGHKEKDLCKEYDLSDGTPRRWKREYKVNSGDFSKKKELSSQELELKRLKKELRDVKMERDILKKAVGIFSVSDD